MVPVALAISVMRLAISVSLPVAAGLKAFAVPIAVPAAVPGVVALAAVVARRVMALAIAVYEEVEESGGKYRSRQRRGRCCQQGARTTRHDADIDDDDGQDAGDRAS
ncbi:hypothetical protein B0H21DRAFT_743651 [Amylocystis lapponica]|nr:hypothetical protein B0H21DRAFT_743651 [Amylocystis lapponica]